MFFHGPVVIVSVVSSQVHVQESVVVGYGSVVRDGLQVKGRFAARKLDQVTASRFSSASHLRLRQAVLSQSALISLLMIAKLLVFF